jgi:hypothetical protein
MLNMAVSSGALRMRFSNDNTTWSAWEAYATGKVWTLSESYGTKTVYAQFDIQGDTLADILMQDTITMPAPSV